MWQPLSKLLSWLGDFGPSFDPRGVTVKIGDPRDPDSEGSEGWRDYLDTQRLWETWGPVPGSPWEPFHCVTLFAALDRLNSMSRAAAGPLADRDLPAYLKIPADPPAWTQQPGTMLILDLPGPRVASAGIYFAAMGGFQPVCTFDNWPNRAGVLMPEQILGGLLHYAAAMQKVREGLAVTSPPMWLCDWNRSRASKPAPGRYDNRYTIEDRLLPGPVMLSSAGIRRIVYVTQDLPPQDALPLCAAWDLQAYLMELKKKGFDVQAVSTATTELFAQTGELEARPPGSWDTSWMGLIRSSAGGFGGFVPQPSSGG
ncbi:MAG: hypothetical protein A3K19_19200 [Lentisphaerae bacterium RIFOXYB12_FULL_65_16]|nr:MAG: hypothetical protein A3K18_02240 [Lentisphaerae bacterium RIFOXYA12_64_32]OGV91582.1 MAG: hypothetical protein A3K19_19200 [Lentisphaerae bacterium RIFOXYB12_FULL_65_16]